jgi:hypothetical protein
MKALQSTGAAHNKDMPLTGRDSGRSALASARLVGQ